MAYTENPTQSHIYKLTLDRPALPSALVIVGDVPLVPVTVIGTAENLRGFDPRTLHTSGNFSKVTVGVNRVPIHVDNPNPNVQIDAPSVVTVTVDQLGSTTQSVAIERVHALPPGFHEQTSSTTVTPAVVRLDGPKSQLAGIQAFVQVDLEQQSGPFDQSRPVLVRYASPSKNTPRSITATPALVSVKMTIQADAVTVTKPVGWTLSGQPAPGYRVSNVILSPLQVNATGLLNTLAGINLLSTDVVDVNNLTTDVVRTVSIRPPAGVTVSQQTVQVHVVITKSAQVSPSASP